MGEVKNLFPELKIQEKPREAGRRDLNEAKLDEFLARWDHAVRTGEPFRLTSDELFFLISHASRYQSALVAFEVALGDALTRDLLVPWAIATRGFLDKVLSFNEVECVAQAEKEETH